MLKLLHRIFHKQNSFLLLLAYVSAFVFGLVALVVTSSGSPSYKQEAFTVFFMCETAVLLFVIPLLAVNRMGSEMLSSTIAQFVSAQMHSGKIAVKIFGHPLVIAILLCGIPGLIALIIREFTGGIPAALAIRAFLMTLAITVFALSIGFYCSVICKTALSAAGMALLILAVICTEPIWFGPVISLAPDTPILIQASLLINPFVGMASALNFDILRTDPLYQICPIGQLRFQYPSCWSVALFNLLAGLFFFWRSATRIRRFIIPAF